VASALPTHVNVGDVLVGKFRVERVLGVGGMGMVLAAMHLELEQRVAIKMMLPDVMRSPEHVERFLREAKSAVKLRSEHVCRVLDVSKLEDGTPFIVMEFMDGHDFAEFLDKHGPLQVADAVDYVMQAIEGIAEAHANHIVHRDLKPQNLFVTTDGDGSPLVKVLDFGISKSAVAGSATKTGELMGSPSYMAPEQMMSAKGVDGRADVWALGVILYQAVTGRLPFEGESLPVLCMSVLHDQPPPPTTYRTDLPPAFGAVIMRCLEKQLPQRFANVGSLAKALVPFGRADTSGTAERVVKMLRRASSPVVAVTLDGPAFVDATANHGSPSVANDARPYGAVSTLQSSAGSMEAFRQPPARARRRLIAGICAALVATAVTAGAFVSSRGDGGSARPAAAPAAATTAPAPAPPPSAQPSVTTAPAAASPPAPQVAQPAPPPSDVSDAVGKTANVAPAKAPPTTIRAKNPRTSAPTSAKAAAATPTASHPATASATTTTTASQPATAPATASTTTSPAPTTSATTTTTTAPPNDPLSRRTRAGN
jgi:serine/threonine-protein kinase